MSGRSESVAIWWQARLDRWLEPAILIAAMAVRVALALVNRQANDDHLQVAHLILQLQRLPVRSDCWECFQPKLYHASLAGLFYLLPWLSSTQQIVLSQLINVVAGGLTLLIIWRFLVWQVAGPMQRSALLALLAFNPALSGINAQATNDSFAILFGTLALYSAARFLTTPGTLAVKRRRDWLGMIAGTILAALSKGTGLIVLVAILATLALVAWQQLRAARALPTAALGQATVLTAVFLLVVPVAGQYWQNWQNYGSPFVINTKRDALPRLYEPTYVYWAGITSIADGYFTFRLDNMLEYPYDTYDDAGYPRHRNSLWSQLYGAANLAQFEEFPLSWASWHPIVQNLGRVIFFLALLPTLAWLWGLFKGVWTTLQVVFRVQIGQPDAALTWLFTLAGWGYAVMIVLYTLQYRSFVTMKAVYVMPGVLASVYFLARSSLGTGRRLGRRGLVLVVGTLSVLSLLNLADLGTLWYQLAK